MTHIEIVQTAIVMTNHGGGFVKALGAALYKADPYNAEIIVNVFPEIMKKYGPNSLFYKARYS